MPRPSIIPSRYLPEARMARIIAHWTAGTNKASNIDRQHYHFILEGTGALVVGNHPVTDNALLRGNNYAAHTLNCNTGSIGIAVAAMFGATETPFDAGAYPLTETQWDVLIEAIAQLCIVYSIPVTPKTVLSHAEVQGNLGIRQRGKWDIARLSFLPEIKGAKAIGDLMRSQVSQILTSKAVA